MTGCEDYVTQPTVYETPSYNSNIYSYEVDYQYTFFINESSPCYTTLYVHADKFDYLESSSNIDYEVFTNNGVREIYLYADNEYEYNYVTLYVNTYTVIDVERTCF